MPTLVHILNRLGVKVEVFCPERLRRNDPFVYANGLRFGLRDSDSLLAKQPAKRFRGFDIVIINSLEPKENLNTAAEVSLPLIGVMHNASLMITGSDYASFFASPKRKALVMAKHISDFVSNQISAGWIAPVELGNVRRTVAGRNDPVRFCVQGNLAYDRRNYTSLVQAVESLISKDIKNFEVWIVGRNDTPDGNRLRAEIDARALGHLFKFSQGELPYKEYYGSIANADFLMPLVDWESTDHVAYFRDKLSTSMQIALAFQVIPIAHTDLARSYGVENESFTYSDDLEEAMQRALKAGDEELRQMRLGLRHKRTELLDASVNNLKTLFEELGLPIIY